MTALPGRAPRTRPAPPPRPLPAVPSVPLSVTMARELGAVVTLGLLGLVAALEAVTDAIGAMCHALFGRKRRSGVEPTWYPPVPPRRLGPYREVPQVERPRNPRPPRDIKA